MTIREFVKHSIEYDHYRKQGTWGKYTVYNVTTNKEICSLHSKPDFYDLYFTTSKNDKTQYYSCTNGKMFYEGVK